MKTLKYLLLLLVVVISFSACVVRRAGYVRGHYDYGPNGGRHWVPGHYVN